MTDRFVDDPRAYDETGIYYPIQTHVFQGLPVYENSQKSCVVHPTHRFLKKEQPQDACDLPVLKLDLEPA